MNINKTKIRMMKENLMFFKTHNLFMWFHNNLFNDLKLNTLSPWLDTTIFDVLFKWILTAMCFHGCKSP